MKIDGVELEEHRGLRGEPIMSGIWVSPEVAALCPSRQVRICRDQETTDAQDSINAIVADRVAPEWQATWMWLSGALADQRSIWRD